MRIFKKYRMKQLTIAFLLMMVLLVIVSSIQINLQYKSYETKIWSKINEIVGRLAEKYPEEEIIQTISSLETDTKTDILDNYGIEQEELTKLLGIQEDIQQNKIMNVLLIITGTISFTVVLIVFILRRDRRIRNITNYLKDINNKKYDLKIEENEEDELSELQNEIYKITVMLKEQAQSLQKDKKELADFLSDISHQIKTPLTSIMIMIDILKENPNLTKEKSDEFILEISRQLDWMNWLIVTLLKMSKLEAGTIQFKKENVVVEELAKQVEKNLSIALELKEQKLEITGENNITYVGDYHWSIEALTNIVKNCIEHSPVNKTIYIQYSQNPLYTEILVRDEGSGISKKDLPHIFTRFYKGENSSKNSIGIGLALAKSIIEEQNGTIEVKSKENEGAQFSIKFYHQSI